MAQTALVSSISRTDIFPIVEEVAASNSCGMLSLTLNGTWTEQMIHELPTLNIQIYLEDESLYSTFEINMTTVYEELKDLQPTAAYSIPIYDIPPVCEFHITPLFDKYALDSHNAKVESGNIDFFNTTSAGIVDTDITNYNTELWTIPTNIFNLTISFDDSNIVPGTGSGGPVTVTAEDVTFQSTTSLSSTNVQAAIEEVDTKVNNLPEPMIFKGSLGTSGTITTLPTASDANKGFTYKVITAGTYQGVECKAGDTIISDGTQWVLIPSGDEPSGTVTNVAVTSTDSSATITGSPITSSGTIDISVNVDSELSNSSTKPVQNKVITTCMTPMTQADYDALVTKDKPIYFVYEA